MQFLSEFTAPADELRELINIKLIMSIIKLIKTMFKEKNRKINFEMDMLSRSFSRSCEARMPINDANILLIHIL